MTWTILTIYRFFRNLTAVKNLKWPAKVRAYLDEATERAEVAQYNMACAI